VKNAKTAAVKRCDSFSSIKSYRSGSDLTMAFTQSEGMTIIELDGGARVKFIRQVISLPLLGTGFKQRPGRSRGREQYVSIFLL
jgi:hypothetical protein